MTQCWLGAALEQPWTLRTALALLCCCPQAVFARSQPNTTPSFPPAPDSALASCKTTEKWGWDDEKNFTQAHPREEGEEVVFLVVDDIAGVPLLPLLWVPKPHGSRPGVSPPTASQALTAPAEG